MAGIETPVRKPRWWGCSWSCSWSFSWGCSWPSFCYLHRHPRHQLGWSPSHTSMHRLIRQATRGTRMRRMRAFRGTLRVILWEAA
jgi:hypothetical protein